MVSRREHCFLVRSKLATLKTDKFLQVKLKIETGEDGKANRVHCYFINYKASVREVEIILQRLKKQVFVNIVKYKLDHMRKKMETSERDQTSRASFKCLNCSKKFTDLEANQLLDFSTGEMR